MRADLPVAVRAADSHGEGAIAGCPAVGSGAAVDNVDQDATKWEEAWIVHALIRADGLTQPAVAELLGRHKSWVCRRLALVEKLAATVQDDLRLGLLTPTAARALVRLPAGNQADVLTTMRQAHLNADELAGLTKDLIGVEANDDRVAT